MIVTKKALPRRTFLRGMGVTLALPLLDSMVPSLTAAAAPVRRLGFIYIPMGCNQKQWFPTVDSGRLPALTPTLTALTPFADQLVLGGNYELKNGYSPGNHATANSSFLALNKMLMCADKYRHRAQGLSAGVMATFALVGVLLGRPRDGIALLAAAASAFRSAARAMIRSNIAPASPDCAGRFEIQMSGVSTARMSSKSPSLFTLRGANSVKRV